MMHSDVIFSCDHHVGMITLHRPQALNAASYAMTVKILRQLELWRDDPSVHAVMIRAMGKAFCVGGDVRWLYHTRENHTQQIDFFAHEYRLNQLIHDYPKPYIAWMHGMTMGGGVGMSLHGSHPVATEHFVFAMPETSIGFFPDVGSSYLFHQCPGRWGAYLALSAARIGPHEALELGLIKYHISHHAFPHVLSFLHASDLSQNAAAQVSAHLARYTLPQAPPSALHDAINRCFAHEHVREIMVHLKQENTPWALETYQLLARKAPLSLCVTLEQLKKTPYLTLAECLDIDRILGYHFLQQPDFYEGVRALLIDKDHTPHWHPDSIEKVSPAMIERYFKDPYAPHNT